jgi:hypothetical protein
MVAFSRPRQMLAKLGYPLSRLLHKRDLLRVQRRLWLESPAANRRCRATFLTCDTIKQASCNCMQAPNISNQNRRQGWLRKADSGILSVVARYFIGVLHLACGLPAHLFSCSCVHDGAQQPCALMKDASEVIFAGTHWLLRFRLNLLNPPESRTLAGQPDKHATHFKWKKPFRAHSQSRLMCIQAVAAATVAFAFVSARST